MFCCLITINDINSSKYLYAAVTLRPNALFQFNDTHPISFSTVITACEYHIDGETCMYKIEKVRKVKLVLRKDLL